MSGEMQRAAHQTAPPRTHRVGSTVHPAPEVSRQQFPPTQKPRPPRLMWQHAIKDDRSLSAKAKSVAQNRALYSNFTDLDGILSSWPSVDGLIADTGFKERSVQRADQELVDHGYLVLVPDHNIPGNTKGMNVYMHTLPTVEVTDEGVPTVVAVPVREEGDSQSPGGVSVTPGGVCETGVTTQRLRPMNGWGVSL